MPIQVAAFRRGAAGLRPRMHSLPSALASRCNPGADGLVENSPAIGCGPGLDEAGIDRRHETITELVER